MLTYQDYLKYQNNLLDFIQRAISEHQADPMVRIAKIADEYDAQRNTTIMNYTRLLYNESGLAYEDTASNNKIACNLFRRLNNQRTTYLLGNGISFANADTKEKLGKTFDTTVFNTGYNALKHGLSFGFWNHDTLINFTLPEFKPLWDESTSALRAGIRFWQLAKDKPMIIVFYEEDGYTKFIKDEKGLYITDEKKPYIDIIQHTDFDGDVIVGGSNYSFLPIVPLWGSDLHQSTLVGMRAKIDSYDLISSGFANDLDDCAEIYWLLGNARGMDDQDMEEFRTRLKRTHVALAGRESTVTPYTQDIPYAARKEFLTMIKSDIYEDFGGLDVHTIAAGATNDHIDAAYQPLDEEADKFEYQVTLFIKQILALNDIEDEPVYKRNRISNQTEQVQMIMQAANYLDQETILNKLPFLTVDEVKEVIARVDREDRDRIIGLQDELNE